MVLYSMGSAGKVHVLSVMNEQSLDVGSESIWRKPV